MGDEKPPIFKCPEEVYLDKEKTEFRFSKINDVFIKNYGHPPQFYARAPGRVNIIGEHIDYCGYAVFPMALEQDLVFAVSLSNDNTYKMTNTNSQFIDYECDAKNFQITGNEWYHYLLCGHQALLDEGKIESPVGMNVVVDGVVPKSAGLSSSSALVCCSGLATMYANKKSLDKLALAYACTRCEKYVGIEGGGFQIQKDKWKWNDL